MSKIALHKRTTLEIPADSTIGFAQYDSNRNAFCFVDELGVAWYFGEQRCRITADTSPTSSSTLADLTGISFPVRANTTYKFEFGVLWLSANVATGVKLGLTCPASPTTLAATVIAAGRAADGTSNIWAGTIKASGDSVIVDAAEEASVVYEATIRGTLVNGANAGTLQVQWASEGTNNITIKAGTAGRLWLP